jgi:Ni/Co efflux regulator RcnB
MKYMITAALALCLMGGAASAQEHDHGGGGGGHEERGGGGPGGGDHRGPGDRGPGPGGPGGGDHRGPANRGPGPGGPGFDHRGPGDRGPGFDRGRGPGGFRGPEPGFRPGAFLRDHGWRGGRFRAPFYRYPVGFGYRRWGFGAYLPGAFLGSQYFLGSYWTYGLPAPPPGYHWIRVGPDALLVRFGDGYVLDAAYGIFY